MRSNKIKEKSFTSLVKEYRLFDSEEESVQIIDYEKNEIYDWRKLRICGQNKLNQKFFISVDVDPQQANSKFDKFDAFMYQNIENFKNFAINKQIEENDGIDIPQSKAKIRYHSIILETANDIFLQYRRKRHFKVLKKHVKTDILI